MRSLSTGAISAIAAAAVALAMVAALLGGLAGGFLVSRTYGASGSLRDAPAGSAVRPKGSIADIDSRALPCVVTIRVVGRTGSGTGPGFVMRQDGYILTNNHVVADGAKGQATVIFSDGQSSAATVIGLDQFYDLAVIRVDRRNLPVLVLGASKDVRVGDPVIAVGAPLGLDSTVTSGIVSALNRPVTAGGSGASSASFFNAIQTDAAINPGNSGGPLLDMASGHRRELGDRPRCWLSGYRWAVGQHRCGFRHSQRPDPKDRRAADRQWQGHASGDRCPD